jgi:hypothetical protein
MYAFYEEKELFRAENGLSFVISIQQQLTTTNHERNVCQP